MASDPRRVQEVFLAAVELADVPARAALLDRECGGDDDLRQGVEALLAAHDASGSFLDSPAIAATGAFAPGVDQVALRADVDAADRTGPGTVLASRYKLVEEIGEGGMGTVWMAQQTEPVRRAVAVKLIKPGMDSKAVLARFEAERQALALMDHPNIAKVLDAGATPAGRPFFVMELVKGVPITQFCDGRRLTPQQRLELFVPVCQASQHAHTKGIIHRDIKPTNVLVALYDDRPVPKVIDFGVAKAAGQPLTERTLMTGYGAVVGTPEYMSPEQANFNQLDIDTRSDVYALGVLLYELLTGSPPFPKKELEKAGLLEMLRVVREVEPPRPSTRLSSPATPAAVAAARGTAAGQLAGLVRGELDWIVMKALEKDRGRRYETANGFAADVRRYLDGEPVEAVPPSLGYRVGKFLSRHRAPVAAAALLLLALVGGLAGTIYGLIQADRARHDAVTAWETEAEQRRLAESERDEKERARQAEAEQRRIAQANEKQAKQERDRAERERKKAERARFALLFTQARAIGMSGTPGGEPDAYWWPLRVQDPKQILQVPELQAKIAQLEKVWAGLRAEFGDDDPDTHAAAEYLAVEYWVVRDVKKAAALYAEVVKGTCARLGPDHPTTLQQTCNLANMLREAGRGKEAIPLLEGLLARAPKLKGPLPKVPSGRHRADISEITRFPGSRGGMMFGYPAARTPMTSDNVPVELFLAHTYAQEGQPARAVEVLRPALAKDSEEPDGGFGNRCLRLHCELALILFGQKRYAEAEPLLRKCVVVYEKRSPDFRLHLLRFWLGLSVGVQGVSLQARDPRAAALNFQEAEPLLTQGYQELKRNPHVFDAEKLVTLIQLSDYWRMRKKPEEVAKLADWKRIDALARQNKWAEAAEEVPDAILASRTQDADLWFRGAALLRKRARRGRDRYDHATHSEIMVTRLGGTQDPRVAARVAMACLIGPPDKGPGSDLKRLTGLAELAVTKGKDDPGFGFFARARALAAYRAGDWKGALAWCDRSRPAAGEKAEHAEAATQAIRAMAQHRLGQAKEAADTLARLDALAAKSDKDLGDHWAGWLVADGLRSEAAGLIQGKAGPKTTRPKK